MLEGWAIALLVVPKGGGGSGWHKIAMCQMHITPILWPIKCGGQGGERWNLCKCISHHKSLAR